MAYGLGFAGGFADLIEASPHRHGGGGRPRARYRLAPWTPPEPPERPPKPDPVTIRVAVHVTWSMSARVVAIGVRVSLGATARRRWRELRDSAEAAVARAWLDGGANLAVALAMLDSVERAEARW